MIRPALTAALVLALPACSARTDNAAAPAPAAENTAQTLSGDPAVACGADGITVTNAVRRADGPYPRFNINFVRADRKWGAVALPDDAEAYRANVDASGRLTLSYAAMTRIVDAESANLPTGVSVPDDAANPAYVFLSESDWIDGEDMDNFSECRQPATPA